ncbi:hypothetical protein CSTERLE_03780 [Thermoclostridium stercorarium subsp. leptospartum DSM 9219]|uniref:Uncharacterized protein n=1 Tax=Thermoclostridium stercorarium subsp. leptospartum DSM 9219 TaxID=1346611 RepID=A0A1B1YJ23_THEST|nr:hypothetical protein CSTERLE_03780 [Thermoclostridium stercorarium subsp. leptospartum DSM 9219]
MTKHKGYVKLKIPLLRRRKRRISRKVNIKHLTKDKRRDKLRIRHGEDGEGKDSGSGKADGESEPDIEN